MTPAEITMLRRLLEYCREQERKRRGEGRHDVAGRRAREASDVEARIAAGEAVRVELERCAP